MRIEDAKYLTDEDYRLIYEDIPLQLYVEYTNEDYEYLFCTFRKNDTSIVINIIDDDEQNITVIRVLRCVDPDVNFFISAIEAAIYYVDLYSVEKNKIIIANYTDFSVATFRTKEMRPLTDLATQLPEMDKRVANCLKGAQELYDLGTSRNAFSPDTRGDSPPGDVDAEIHVGHLEGIGR